MPQKITVSVSEAAALIGVSVSTVRTWLRAGTLPYSRLPGRRGDRGTILIRIADIEAMLDGARPEAMAVAAWAEMGTRARKALAILDRARLP
jgi:excisionase family DNA binding protein